MVGLLYHSVLCRLSGMDARTGKKSSSARRRLNLWRLSKLRLRHKLRESLAGVLVGQNSPQNIQGVDGSHALASCTVEMLRIHNQAPAKLSESCDPSYVSLLGSDPCACRSSFCAK